MPERSRLEINIRRLLGQCETLAKDDLNLDWKLEQYIESLQDMIEKLQSSPSKPCRDVMVKYIKRVEFLRGLLNTKKLDTPTERAAAAQLLPVNIIGQADSTDGFSVTTQIQKKTTAKYGQEMRNELFNLNSASEDDGLRKRLLNPPGPEQDSESTLKHHGDMQEKIAQNMIYMAMTMKDQALTANQIIKKDITSLEKSDKLTDLNTTKLKTESVKLEEHTKSHWRCWMWVMIAFVLVVFFNMVLFIRVAKKRVN